MSAAHCGWANPLVTFRMYNELSATASRTESVRCWYMLQTLPTRPLETPNGTDLTLFYCPDIASVAPGLKYGYMDFDSSVPAVGQTIYSFWRNNVASLNVNDAMLYSPGEVTSLQTASWIQPGLDMDVWATSGASGSASIRPDTQRIHIGPTSTGPGAPSEGPSRSAMSMYDYLNTATLDSSVEPRQVNVQELPAKGVFNLYQYDGLLDKNNNNVFDMQEAIEEIDGEPGRDHYWLGFDSERRNALWMVNASSQASARFYPGRNLVHLNIGAAGPWALQHRALNLKPDTDYRVSVMVHTNNAIDRHALSFRMISGGFGVDSFDIPTNPGTGWELNTFHLRTGASANTLLIVSNAEVNASLAALSLIEEGSVMDFDTYDKRIAWRNESNGDRAFILPDGRGGDHGPDWAAVVGPTRDVEKNLSWPLRNRQLALVEGETYQICFYHKRYLGLGAAEDEGIMRLVSAGKVLVEKRFVPSRKRWERPCTDFVRVESSDNNLLFGRIGNGSSGHYLVDDIEIVRG